MKTRILLIGSAGLVGTAVRAALEKNGAEVIGLDLRSDGKEFGDIREANSIAHAFQGCTGIIQLAAVSRVIFGERDPANCWATNVEGVRNVLSLALAQNPRPWLIFASSREVYGQPDSLPVSEDFPLKPVNVYGRSKVEGENIVHAARSQGLRATVIRLSNVYGSTHDHPDRVVPAFARGAVMGSPLRVDGADHTFDFTHLDDTVRGILALASRLEAGGEALPPIHFLTGQATSLGQLAELAKELAGSPSEVVQAPPRNFDVSTFQGDPERARLLLDWTPRISIREGLGRLIADFRAELDGADGVAIR